MNKKKKGLGELGRGTWASRLRPRTPFLVRGLGLDAYLGLYVSLLMITVGIHSL